ncbi:hypothetical protein [Oceanobacillus indicireducens]|uniref:Uncharacterized protein n=1 Tax=Oceanobacillus indicireducens TaxID=1004261 RepID=A0A917Y0K4_9BACI|nr:hypothetical protein [Oceanobacillus indicireducens]GGN62497.1 hypothetical protein GCM10007971_28480 [Oceanobacillus indicireducens]
MALISKLIPIGVFALSFAGGILFFYITSDLSKNNKKIHIEQMVSELINVVIFIWIGKILTNLKLFIQDPLAVLAYPSDSQAFYLAILISGIILFINVKRGKINAVPFMKAFIPVILVASFLYEFIYLVWLQTGGTIGYFILISLLLILYYIVHDQLPDKLLFIMLLVVWSVGVFILYSIQPFVTVFGYIIAPWFVWLFFTINIVIILRKRDRRGRN